MFKINEFTQYRKNLPSTGGFFILNSLTLYYDTKNTNYLVIIG